MPLIKCPECKKTISSEAESCPNCGCPKSKFFAAKKPSWLVPSKGATLVLVVVVLWIVVKACSGPDSNNSQPATNNQSSSAPTVKPISVSASKLFKDYEANEVSADTKYKGKLLKVTGVVQSISITLGDLTVILGQDDQYNEYGILGVQCTLPDSYKDAVSKLKKGERITLHGTCTGKSINIGLDVQ